MTEPASWSWSAAPGTDDEISVGPVTTEATAWLTAGEHVIPATSMRFPGYRYPPAKAGPPTDSLGTPVHTAYSVRETVTAALLDEPMVRSTVTLRLRKRIEDWAKANGYLIDKINREVLNEPSKGFGTSDIRLTATVEPREDGEWPAIRRAVHEDQLALTSAGVVFLPDELSWSSPVADPLAAIADAVDAYRHRRPLTYPTDR